MRLRGRVTSPDWGLARLRTDLMLGCLVCCSSCVRRQVCGDGEGLPTYEREKRAQTEQGTASGHHFIGVGFSSGVCPSVCVPPCVSLRSLQRIQTISGQCVSCVRMISVIYMFTRGHHRVYLASRSRFRLCCSRGDHCA